METDQKDALVQDSTVDLAKEFSEFKKEMTERIGSVANKPNKEAEEIAALKQEIEQLKKSSRGVGAFHQTTVNQADKFLDFINSPVIFDPKKDGSARRFLDSQMKQLGAAIASIRRINYNKQNRSI